jgi:hypothetical protein
VSALRELVASGAVGAELAALVWVLAEQGVPLVVAASDGERAATVRHAFSSQVLAEQRARDAVAGGTVIASSLEDVLRVLGAHAESGHGHDDAGLADEARDLGVVLVVDLDRVHVAHYVRPVERDAAGHLQRRPPAVLAAWNSGAAAFDDFWWAVTDELASRTGLTRHQLEDEVESRQRRLRGDDSVPGRADARH